jgi:hypothetical protein
LKYVLFFTQNLFALNLAVLEYKKYKKLFSGHFLSPFNFYNNLPQTPHSKSAFIARKLGFNKLL